MRRTRRVRVLGGADDERGEIVVGAVGDEDDLLEQRRRGDGAAGQLRHELLDALAPELLVALARLDEPVGEQARRRALG